MITPSRAPSTPALHDSNGRTIWIVDAHRDNGKRLIVRADEELTAFVGLESATSRSRSLEKRTSVVLP